LRRYWRRTRRADAAGSHGIRGPGGLRTSTPPAPITVSLARPSISGGRPGVSEKIIDLGSKDVLYKDLKVIFIDGKVSDVQ